MKDFKDPKLYLEEQSLFNAAKKRYTTPDNLDKIIQDNKEWERQQELEKNAVSTADIGGTLDDFSLQDDQMDFGSDKYKDFTDKWTIRGDTPTINSVPITTLNSASYLSQAQAVLGLKQLDINQLAKNSMFQNMVIKNGIIGAGVLIASKFQLAGFAFGLPLIAAAGTIAYFRYKNGKMPKKPSVEDNNPQKHRPRPHHEPDNTDKNGFKFMDDDDDEAFFNNLKARRKSLQTSNQGSNNKIKYGPSSKDGFRIPQITDEDELNNPQDFIHAAKDSTFGEDYDIAQANDVDDFYEYAEGFLQYVIDNRRKSGWLCRSSIIRI
ncbi:hypothetical protein [Fructilactobacillus sanfranciscensis]|uniref:hypothetical protein n=1 Tax=Fructilactobacillus sanfranciscensis TaxID=1625 RepID=UPI000CD49174|nr:hypothetical protein [Fructilactobacillus sanfranciscensis]POH19084.1 hypothetical protein BGL45_05900 [Fructilactobacillus sanfranciscensis]